MAQRAPGLMVTGAGGGLCEMPKASGKYGASSRSDRSLQQLCSLGVPCGYGLSLARALLAIACPQAVK